MSEEMDAILHAMQELTTTVKEHKEDPATVDYERLAKEFAAQYDELVKAQGEKGRGRLGESTFEDVDQDGNRTAVKRGETPVVASGKFAGMKVTDLYLAKRMLAVAQRYNDQAPGPSDELVKAMDSTTGGSGDEFVPTLLASELWDQVYLQSRIAQALGPLVTMPSNPWKVPLWSTFTWYKGTENTATTASNPTTADSTMTTTEILAEVNWSYTLDEDSIIPMLPNLRAELVRSGAEIMDAFFLNADATATSAGNINLDDDTPDSKSYYLSAGQDGIRHYWLVDDTGQGHDMGGLTLADSKILVALASMGKYAIRPDDTFLVTDVQTYFKGLMNLDGVQTLDKYGPNAVLLTGELARYRGIPIIVSESAPLTMSDGKVDTTGNTLGQLSIVNRAMWMVGARRRLMIEVDRDIQKRQMLMVASMRVAIAARDRTSDHSAGIYNISVA